MKFSLITPETDRQITEIRRKIRLSMNGIVSGQMAQGGIAYKKNYGVSIPRLREIAGGYTPSHDLAQQLRSLRIRETIILATMLEPIGQCNPEIADDWTNEFDQVEIIEQSVMNLFCKLPFAPALSTTWIQSGKTRVQVAGFMLAARISNKFSKNEIHDIVENAIEKSATKEYHLYKAIALCLSRFCRIDKETALHISGATGTWGTSSAMSQQCIANEVKQEILFLDIL